MDFELMFDDLKENVQYMLLKHMGIDSPSEANWDVFPVAYIPDGDA